MNVEAIHPLFFTYYYHLNSFIVNMSKNVSTWADRDSEASCEGVNISKFGCRYVFYLGDLTCWRCTGIFGLQVVLTLPVNKQPWFPGANNLLNLHIIFFPGSGVVLIKMLITTSDLILCRRHFLRLLAMKKRMFPMLLHTLVFRGWKWSCLILLLPGFILMLN